MSTYNAVLRSRFAPTPSGYLHIGNVFSFIITWLYVKQRNGKIHLRIDDMDRDRVRPEYVENIFETLEWLGLNYDSGPENVSDFEAHHSQLTRIDLYKDAFKKLVTTKVLFSCNCSRKEIGDKPYGGKCRKNVDIEENKNIRIQTVRDSQYLDDELIGAHQINLAGRVKDFVVWRKNNSPSYQLASVIDDIHFKTNCIVRGTGLLESTGAQLYLAGHLGKNSFEGSKFIHHPLLKSNGHKISKSQSHPSVFDEFKTPEQVFIFVGNILGLTIEQSETLELLKEQFNFEDYKKSIYA